MTNDELHKGLLEFLGYREFNKSGVCLSPKCFNVYRPEMDANLIRLCHEKMTPEQRGEYMLILWGDKKHRLSDALIAPLPKQAAAILKAVGKE